MEEIVKLVAEKAGLPEAQAKKAVETVLDVLKERLPKPLADQVENVLAGAGGGADDLLKGVGGLFGKK